MNIILVSRHAGAIEWVKRQGIVVDRQVSHYDPESAQNGDIIIGTLPVHHIARICELGAHYLHLEIHIPEQLRGKELSADMLEQLGAQLCGYYAYRDDSVL